MKTTLFIALMTLISGLSFNLYAANAESAAPHTATVFTDTNSNDFDAYQDSDPASEDAAGGEDMEFDEDFGDEDFGDEDQSASTETQA